MIKQRFRGVSSSLSALLFATVVAPSATSAESALGTVNFQTTCKAEANAAFNEGLALLHHMMYVQADVVFSDAAETNPNCAMLHWGTAMSKFHPLWPGILKPEALNAGREAVARLSVAKPGSEIEQAFSAAVAA